MNSLEEFWEFTKHCPAYIPDPEVQTFVEALVRGELVETAPRIKMKQMFGCPYWHSARSVIGFVSPTLEWARSLKRIIGDKTVLEVGAGTGLLAKYLDAVGIHITATDDYSWHKKDFSEWKPFFPVEDLDFKEAITKYNTDYLLICWPMYEDSLAREAAELFTKLNPDGIIIYIGEGAGGCTADDEFHDGIEELDYPDELYVLYPQWAGLWDQVYLCRWTGKINFEEVE